MNVTNPFANYSGNISRNVRNILQKPLNLDSFDKLFATLISKLRTSSPPENLIQKTREMFIQDPIQHVVSTLTICKSFSFEFPIFNDLLMMFFNDYLNFINLDSKSTSDLDRLLNGLKFGLRYTRNTRSPELIKILKELYTRPKSVSLQLLEIDVFYSKLTFLEDPLKDLTIVFKGDEESCLEVLITQILVLSFQLHGIEKSELLVVEDSQASEVLSVSVKTNEMDSTREPSQQLFSNLGTSQDDSNLSVIHVASPQMVEEEEEEILVFQVRTPRSTQSAKATPSKVGVVDDQVGTMSFLGLDDEDSPSKGYNLFPHIKRI